MEPAATSRTSAVSCLGPKPTSWISFRCQACDMPSGWCNVPMFLNLTGTLVKSYATFQILCRPLPRLTQSSSISHRPYRLSILMLTFRQTIIVIAFLRWPFKTSQVSIPIGCVSIGIETKWRERNGMSGRWAYLDLDWSGFQDEKILILLYIHRTATFRESMGVDPLLPWAEPHNRMIAPNILQVRLHIRFVGCHALVTVSDFKHR